MKYEVTIEGVDEETVKKLQQYAMSIGAEFSSEPMQQEQEGSGGILGMVGKQDD